MFGGGGGKGTSAMRQSHQLPSTLQSIAGGGLYPDERCYAEGGGAVRPIGRLLLAAAEQSIAGQLSSAAEQHQSLRQSTKDCCRNWFRDVRSIAAPRTHRRGRGGDMLGGQ